MLYYFKTIFKTHITPAKTITTKAMVICSIVPIKPKALTGEGVLRF
ncbi:hypothetical protein NU09_2471 [Flavobacterium beibuense]|uniref:Uncharacterized protein n=1 Tax=Flavobacterium beibuense TaxID=657326 RepID=A0A444W837_9FLAO|nr:hypothetical protein NU09_2471 [Flavobacterium beibuense]